MSPAASLPFSLESSSLSRGEFLSSLTLRPFFLTAVGAACSLCLTSTAIDWGVEAEKDPSLFSPEEISVSLFASSSHRS